MIENSKNEVYENGGLLKALMALLNIAAVAMVGLVIWSVYSIVENSTAIARIMDGSLLQ